MIQTWSVKALLAILSVMSLCCAGAQASDDGMTNDQVVALLNAGLSNELVVQKINTSETNFDTKSEAMVKLKEAGVPDEIISIMLERQGQQERQRQSAVDMQIQRLASPNEELRSAAEIYILRMGARAFPQLRAKLSSQYPLVRAASARMLGKLGDKDSARELRLLLVDSKSDVRIAAAEALAVLQDSMALEAARKAVSAGLAPLDGHLHLLGSARDIDSVGFVRLRLLQDKDPTVRRISAWALGEIGSDRGRDALEHALIKDRDGTVKIAAAAALGKIKNPVSVKALIYACRRDPSSRITILSAMAEFEAKDVAEFLIYTLKQELSKKERQTVLSGLRKLLHQDLGPSPKPWFDWWTLHGETVKAGEAIPVVTEIPEIGPLDMTFEPPAPAQSDPAPTQTDELEPGEEGMEPSEFDDPTDPGLGPEDSEPRTVPEPVRMDDPGVMEGLDGVLPPVEPGDDVPAPSDVAEEPVMETTTEATDEVDQVELMMRELEARVRGDDEEGGENVLPAPPPLDGGAPLPRIEDVPLETTEPKAKVSREDVNVPGMAGNQLPPPISADDWATEGDEEDGPPPPPDETGVEIDLGPTGALPLEDEILPMAVASGPQAKRATVVVPSLPERRNEDQTAQVGSRPYVEDMWPLQADGGRRFAAPAYERK